MEKIYWTIGIISVIGLIFVIANMVFDNPKRGK